MRSSALLAVLAGGLLLAACGESPGSGVGTQPPQAVPTVVDAAAAQPHQLYTHCGVQWTEFQGKAWYADPPLSDGSGNPPPGFGNPVDQGTMRQLSAHQAQYVSSSGKVVPFIDTLPPGASPPGLCS